MYYVLCIPIKYIVNSRRNHLKMHGISYSRFRSRYETWISPHPTVCTGLDLREKCDITISIGKCLFFTRYNVVQPQCINFELALRVLEILLAIEMVKDRSFINN